jgi:hypothetical protein
MALIGTYVYIDPQAERVRQLIFAVGPVIFVFMMRLVVGRSKEMMVAVWLSLGWFAIRASLSPALEPLIRRLERLL